MKACYTSAAARLLALAAMVLCLPPFAAAMDRLDFGVSPDMAYDLSVATSDARSVIVAWSAQWEPRVVRTRAMSGQEWAGEPVELGEGDHPRVLADQAGRFRLVYAAESAIVYWHGVPGEMQGPELLSAGGQAIEGAPSLCMAPDGTLFLAWKQGDSIWWTWNAPPYAGWSVPCQELALDVTGLQILPRLVEGAWRPRAYYLTAGTALAWRQYDGVAWGPENLIALDPPVADSFQAVLLADGRHAIFCSQMLFCGVHFYEEDAEGIFQWQPWLLTHDDPACTIADGVAEPFFATTAADGALHVFRDESCFEWHDNDLWGCGFRLIWQWRTAPGEDWQVAGENDFPGAWVYHTVMACALAGEEGPVFAWLNPDGVQLRIMNPSPTDAPENWTRSLRLRAAPNPAPGAVSFRWAAPASAEAGVAAELRLFDAAGRLVRSWSIAGAREGRLLWDGRDGDGQPVASGVYLARMQRGEETASLPIVLLR